MENKQIWENIKNGDVKSLKQLHVRYFYQMCLFAQKTIHDNQLVENIVSDCFIKLWENRGKIEIERSIKSYLYGILRNIPEQLRMYLLNVESFWAGKSQQPAGQTIQWRMVERTFGVNVIHYFFDLMPDKPVKIKLNNNLTLRQMNDNLSILSLINSF